MKKTLSKIELAQIATNCFFILAIISIVSEFIYNDLFITLSKPLILPLLILIYLLSSAKASKIYLLALILNWSANIFFLSHHSDLIFTATILLLLSRMFILVTIFERIKNVNLIPIILGSIPFFFLSIYLIYLIFDTIYGLNIVIVFLHSLIVSLIGGYSLGNYVMKNDEASKYLMVSSLFFTLNVFVLGVKNYYLDLAFLRPVALIFFLTGHYIFFRFIMILENDKSI
jgi:hypothetical protein